MIPFSFTEYVYYFCCYYNKLPANRKDSFMNYACKFPFLFIFFVKFNCNFWYVSYEYNKKHNIFCPFKKINVNKNLPQANSYLILNIPSGFRNPHPCLFFPSPQSIALSIRRIFTSRLESHGSLDSKRAIVPDTIGVAIEVPLLFL